MIEKDQNWQANTVAWPCWENMIQFTRAQMPLSLSKQQSHVYNGFLCMIIEQLCCQVIVHVPYSPIPRRESYNSNIPNIRYIYHLFSYKSVFCSVKASPWVNINRGPIEFAMVVYLRSYSLPPVLVNRKLFGIWLRIISLGLYVWEYGWVVKR